MTVRKSTASILARLRKEALGYLEAKQAVTHYDSQRKASQDAVLDLMEVLEMSTTLLDQDDGTQLQVTTVRPEGTPSIDHDATRENLEAAGITDAYTKRRVVVYEPDDDLLAELLNDRRTAKHIVVVPGREISPSIRVTIVKSKKGRRPRG